MKRFITDLLNKDSYAGYIFIMPALIGTVVFIIIPIFCSFGLSFTKWDLLNDISYVGLSNYKAVLTEPIFVKILINTFVYAITTTFFGVLIPLILAYILSNKIIGSEFFKISYFIPFITPMVVIGIVWEWIFDPNIGFFAKFLQLHINWLYDTNFAMPALIIVSVWKLIGYNVVIFLSGFSTISKDIFEASKIDGANSYQILKNITIPLLSPTIFFVVIITAISSFQVFDLIFIMTQGGPLNSTNVIVYSIYKNAFEYFNIGKASALAYILFLIIFILTAFQWQIRKNLVYLEKD
ncbi:sugar ABC transporter permease [bacterium]|nr:sugar ABC transporter permease [bacterium]